MFHSTFMNMLFPFFNLWHRLMAVGIGVLFSMPVMLAQRTDQSTDSTLLQTVVIQATRTGAHSPIPHTNYGARDIARQYQAQDVPFLLSGVPSLVESSDAGTGIGYTGMRIRGSDPTRVNVTINGIPINDAESQGVFWVDLPDLATSAAEIQVQRGVGSSTNGAGAFGATVNLDISRIEPEPFAVLTNSLGSFSTAKQSVYVGTGLLGNRFAFSGRLSRISSDGYIDRASADLKSYHVSGAYIDSDQSVQFHLLSGKEITYQAWNGLPAQYLDIDSLRTYNSAGTERPGTPYDNEVDDYTQQHFLLHYKRNLSQQMSVQVNGHYTRGYGYYEQYKAGQEYADYTLPPLVLGDTVLQQTDLIRQRWLDNDFYGGTFALRWKPAVNPPLLGKPPEFMLGGAWSRYEGRHFGDVIWSAYGFPDDFRYYDNDATKNDGNVYGKMELHFRGGLSVFTDLQYRAVDYTFLGFDQNQQNVTQTAELRFFNPKAGLIWQFHSNANVYAFWGVGQREPNRDDYTQSTPESRPLPERMNDWEGGFRFRKSGHEMRLNLFFMDYRDQLVLDGRINDVGAYIRTNVPDSYRTGAELEATVQAGRQLTFAGNVAISRNKVKRFTAYLDNWDTGEQESQLFEQSDLAFSPSVVARGELRWQPFPDVEKHQFQISIAGKYVGKQYLDNTENEQTALPAYFFSDLRLNYDLADWLGQRMSLILAVNNLFDATFISNGWVYRYISAGYDDRPNNPYTRLETGNRYYQAGFFPQAGRNLMATLSVRF